MQHIMEMWREAKAVDTRAKRLTSWVHLDYWTKALVRRIERVITQNAEMGTFRKVSILTGEWGKEQFMRLQTYPPFSPWQRRGRGPSRSQTPEPCCQRGRLPASTSGRVCRAVNGCIQHKADTSHTLLFLLRTSPHLFINPHDASPDLPRFSAVVHHRQDATGRFQNHHSVFVPGKREQVKRRQTSVFRKRGFLQKSLTSSFSSWCICPGHIPSYLWM